MPSGNPCVTRWRVTGDAASGERTAVVFSKNVDTSYRDGSARQENYFRDSMRGIGNMGVRHTNGRGFVNCLLIERSDDEGKTWVVEWKWDTLREDDSDQPPRVAERTIE